MPSNKDLWISWESGQISRAEFERLKKENPSFKAYVAQRNEDWNERLNDRLRGDNRD